MNHIARGVLGLACLGMVAHAPAARAAEAKLKAAAFLPSRVIFAKFFYDWVKETNRQCAGKVRISVVGPGAIASLEQWNAVKNGVVDMHYGPAAYMRGAMPAGDVLVLAENTAAEQRKNGAHALFVDYYKKKMNAVYLTHILDGVKMFIYTTKAAPKGSF